MFYGEMSRSDGTHLIAFNLFQRIEIRCYNIVHSYGILLILDNSFQWIPPLPYFPIYGIWLNSFPVFN
ncbi:hypothetical protein HYN56_16145 [Flavobacterium crocinum]|uniref:Uncharacterized protein n=1 Tax=Flavobacterium crocinum TaxID=2183896 RepID=A0A2S1YNM1_9FLAO|nr:hypothetical protein HYN56_16145 [Flavobacterium crocinum]